MPTYDYRCNKCGHLFELFHGIKDETRKRCPKCRSLARRVPSGGVGLLFKGSGFYITDYRSKSYKDKARQEKGSPSSSGDKGTSSSGGDKGSASSGGSKGAPSSGGDKKKSSSSE